MVAFESGKRWFFGGLMILLVLLSLCENGSDIGAAVKIEDATFVVLLVVVVLLWGFTDILMD